MKLSDLIEQYILDFFKENEMVELKRSELANKFNCVPSQINYVISTRFIPELGFYVESRRGGGGYIKICRTNLNRSDYISDIIDKISQNLSQTTLDVYLNDFVRYNILNKKTANIVRVALSDKSLAKVDKYDRDLVRSDMLKNIIVNII
jgi:transcriptional repressor, ctsR